MKTILRICVMLFFCLRLNAQAQEIQQLKLDIEKLAQFKQILSQMKQGYQVLQNGYNSVRDAAKGNFDLHKSYLDGLLQVNPSVKLSPGLQQIATDQNEITKTFQTAWQQYQASGLFTASELSDLRNQYNAINQKVNDGLDILSQTITPAKLRMSDAERLQIIDVIRADVSLQLETVKKTINDYSRLLVLRTQQKKDNNALRKLSGLK